MSDKAYLAALHRVDELKRERDLARRDYERMNKFREAAEAQCDLLRETLEKIATTAHGYHDADAAYMAGLARAALAEMEDGE